MKNNSRQFRKMNKAAFKRRENWMPILQDSQKKKGIQLQGAGTGMEAGATNPGYFY